MGGAPVAAHVVAGRGTAQNSPDNVRRAGSWRGNAPFGSEKFNLILVRGADRLELGRTITGSHRLPVLGAVEALSLGSLHFNEMK